MTEVCIHGRIQPCAGSIHEAFDLHIQAFKLAEQLSLPVMVCMDGFILTHAEERLEPPSPTQVDGFLPPYGPRQVLDPSDPATIGAMVGPEAFTEVKYLAHSEQMRALSKRPTLARMPVVKVPPPPASLAASCASTPR